MKKNSENSALITKLTALWAVSESGLGGILHAMKMPFSGLLLGSFAVIMVTFIAMNSDRKFNAVLQATLIVILIKAIASPHSPPTAYVAVAFQGIIGAVIYSIFRINRISAVFYGVIALLESALQKLLMMVLVFGTNIWEAFQKFFNSLAEPFHLKSLEILPLTLVSLYCLIYFLVGILAGNWAVSLPYKIRTEASLLQDLNFSEQENPELKKRKKKNPAIKLIGIFFILMFIVTVFVFSGSLEKARYAVLRTAAALALIFFVVNPLFKFLVKTWKNSQQRKNRRALAEVLMFVPEFRINAGRAWSIADQENSLAKKIKKFLLVWMALSLYSNEKNEALKVENHHDF